MTGVEELLKTLAFADPVVLPALLFQMMQLVRVGLEELLYTAPPPSDAFIALLPEKVQLMMFGMAPCAFCIPPPKFEVLPAIRQLVIVGLLPELVTPPPVPVVLALFPKNWHLEIVGLEFETLYNPAPVPPLRVFPENVQLVIAGLLDSFLMPAPLCVPVLFVKLQSVIVRLEALLYIPTPKVP